MSNLRDVRYGRNREKIEEAFNLYATNNEIHLNQLLEVVTTFAKGKMVHSMNNTDEAYTTPDDYAQAVAMKTWRSLPAFVGDGASFYSWLNRVCYTTESDAHEELSKGSEGKVPLMVESEDEPGLMEDNPLLSRNTRAQTVRALPEFIQGTDKLICSYLREGVAYKEIGRILLLSEAAVKLRIEKMRNRIQKEKQIAKS